MKITCAGDGEYQIIRTRGSKVTFSDGGPCGWGGVLGGGVIDLMDCPVCGGRVQEADKQ